MRIIWDGESDIARNLGKIYKRQAWNLKEHIYFYILHFHAYMYM